MSKVGTVTLEPSVAWQFAHEATTRAAKLEGFVDKAFARMAPMKPEFARLANLYHPIGLLRLADGRPDEAIASWRTGLWFRRSQLRLSAHPAPESVPLTVPGADAEVDFVGHGKPWLRSTWLRSLFKAEALGESATVTALLDFENFTELYEDFPSLQIPRQGLHQALFSGSDQTATLLAEAVSSIDPAGMPSDRAAFATGRLVAEYGLADAILQGDQERFHSAVVEAHNAHVAWFSGVGEDDSPRNLDRNVLVDWPLSGLVALGQRRGLALPPQSPYAVSASLDSGV